MERPSESLGMSPARWFLVAAVVMCAIAAKPASVLTTPLVQVIDRQILGTYIEDVDFVRTGPLARHLVAVSGSGLYGALLDAAGPRGFRKLFDLRGLPLVTISPRGVAWVESERSFAFIQTGQLQQLVFTDASGSFLSSRAIQYVNGFVPSHAEGLAYVPRSSPRFPDHLVTVAWEATGSRLEIVARTGEVVAEIIPALGFGLLSSVAYDVSGRLLVGFERFEPFARELYAIDFDGNVMAGPIPADDFPEGIAQSSDKRIWVTNFDQVQAYDESFSRVSADDKSFRVGLGLALPIGLAWDSDADRYLVNIWRGTHSVFRPFAREIAAIPATLDSYSIIAQPGLDPVNTLTSPDDLSYLPDEHRFVVASRQPPSRRGLAIYNADGSWHELIRLRKPDGSVDTAAQPVAVEYIPAEQRFAVRLVQQPSKVKFYERNGSFANEFDLASYGIVSAGSLAYFNPTHPTGGQFLFFASAGRALVTDFHGTRLDEFNYRSALDLWTVTDVTAITTGPRAGAFGVVDAEVGELVGFTLDGM